MLDEADRLLEMGFAEEVRELVQLAPPKRQTMLFSGEQEGCTLLDGLGAWRLLLLTTHTASLCLPWRPPHLFPSLAHTATLATPPRSPAHHPTVSLSPVGSVDLVD